METASQRDHDVVAGCQYYYGSRNVIENPEVEEERNVEESGDRIGNDEINVNDDSQEEVSFEGVSMFSSSLKTRQRIPSWSIGS